MDKFKCNNGKCIEKTKFCDHSNDCEDRSDEPSECTCFSFLKATAPEKICDGIRHCWDKSDEDPHYCGTSIPKQMSFKCGKSAFVIPMEMVCDGRTDCPNGADEFACQTINNSTDGFGEVMARSFGVWYSECFPKSSEPDFDTIGKNLCNSSKFTARIINRNDTQLPAENSPAIKVVSETKFSAVQINDGFTVHLRTDKPLTKVVEWDDDDHANCHRLEVKCG